MKQSLATLFILLFFGCTDKHKFDKEGWGKHDGLMKYPKRNDMVQDLIDNYLLKGKKYTEIINLLGEPFPAFNFATDTAILYPIEMGFDNDHLMNHTKALTLIVNKDSTVQSYKVVEWKK